MFTKSKRIICFSVFVLFGLLFFISAFFPEFSFNTVSSLLKLSLNTERWLPIIGKLLFGISFICFASAFSVLFSNQLQNLYKEHNILFYAIAFFIIALVCRFASFGFESLDYKVFLKPWFDTFKDNRIDAIRSNVGDYTVLYKYLILLFTFFPINPLYSYKLLSIIFDFLISIYSGLFICKITGSKTKALLEVFAVLFAFTFTNYYYIAIITIFSSLPGLVSFLFGINGNVNLVFMGYIMFIVLLFRVVHKEIRLEINKT